MLGHAGQLPKEYTPNQVKQAIIKLGGLQPMNIFLRQEIDRIQKILSLVRNTLKNLTMAIEGTVVMNHQLKEIMDNMLDPLFLLMPERVSWGILKDSEGF